MKLVYSFIDRLFKFVVFFHRFPVAFIKFRIIHTVFKGFIRFRNKMMQKKVLFSIRFFFNKNGKLV